MAAFNTFSNTSTELSRDSHCANTTVPRWGMVAHGKYTAEDSLE
eukprot:CAMPEP_0197737692 /NCGR_PEP_ID=MMETSP1435-20131217/10422_1 /TAXON_ID=426625 /ORGANISM="Chaetoceros brevis, Strain CCMP164" /LENGTH=43 /DNA_ID= /DNA_START= /DNA_END= /DNA_ORIENTATION=